MPFAVADLIDGHYRVEQRFAGGMGFVYIVRDEVVGKRFAIKQLSELHAENDILRERFRREASTWLLLDYHPHIVQAHSFLPRADAPMLILEYVDGPGLDRLLRAEKKLPSPQVVSYARQVCSAMQHAHGRVIPERGVGVLHRDIKPGNLLLNQLNHIKITDFGLAKIQGDPNLTSEGQFVGTVAYSPPEQLRGAGDVSKASDVYSFGAVMYQMVTGRQPFRGSNPAELYHAVHETEPRPIEELTPDVEPDLVDVIRKCLRKNAADRFSDFHELELAVSNVKLANKPLQVTCHRCGFISSRSLTKCSVCGSVLQARKATTEKATRSKGTARKRKVANDPLPVSGLTDSTPESPGEQRAVWNLDPAKEYLVELKANKTIVPRPLERSGYTVGRAENMKIRIDDSTIARYQLFLVRLPCGWLAINPQLHPPVQMNGWPTRQRLLRPGDLIQVGNTWLAFAGPATAYPPLTAMPGRWAEWINASDQTVRVGGSRITVLNVPPRASCTLELAGDHQYVSRGQPLRVGTSPLCEVRVDDPTVAPIHAMVAWHLDGPHLTNIVSGGLCQLGGEEVTDRVLQDGDLFQIGNTPLRARLEGDRTLPGRRWAETLSHPGRFALTVLTGPHRGQTALLPSGQNVVLGRHSDCDAIITADSFVSRRHMQVTANETEIDFKDLGSRSGFFLNQTHFTDTAVARLGDVIVVGKTSLLVHHELESD